MPIWVCAIQVVGGGEFMAEYEVARAERSMALFVLPPRSRKFNRHGERANGIHRREFWECYALPPLRADRRA